VVWEGRSRKAPPYPDSAHIGTVLFEHGFIRTVFRLFVIVLVGYGPDLSRRSRAF